MRRLRRPHLPRRVPLRGPQGILILLVIALVLLVRWWQEPKEQIPESLGEGIYAVAKVVDGDTLALANTSRVRLIGVDTPETVKPNHPVEPFGPEASEFTRRFVARGDWSVRLEFDRERQDKYGRFLAYVWIDDQMLNEELVRAGLARVETQYRYAATMKKRLLAAEAEAKAAKRGIWSRHPPAGQATTCDRRRRLLKLMVYRAGHGCKPSSDPNSRRQPPLRRVPRTSPGADSSHRDVPLQAGTFSRGARERSEIRVKQLPNCFFPHSPRNGNEP